MARFESWIAVALNRHSAHMTNPLHIYDLGKVVAYVPNVNHIIIIIMVIFKCYFSGELIALSYKKKQKNNNNSGVNIELGKTNRLKALCMMEIKK